jgi:hypothetical protein
VSQDCGAHIESFQDQYETANTPISNDSKVMYLYSVFVKICVLENPVIIYEHPVRLKELRKNQSLPTFFFLKCSVFPVKNSGQHHAHGTATAHIYEYYLTATALSFNYIFSLTV